jgi:Ser/Thr protein kinase RdoA (MazF antagonist)
MPDLLQKLHSLPKFPGRIHYFDTMEGFIEKFQTTQMLPEGATKEVLEYYKQMARVYPCNDFNDWVCCHNDLKPENLLFDGQRPWIVDWESAFLNDRYLDLAVASNFLVKNELEESGFLQQYFGRPASSYQMARHFWMGMLLHVYYFTFLMLSAFKGNPVDLDQLGDEDFSSFHDRMWKEEINLAEEGRKRQYAWVHRNELLRKIRTRRYEDSMRILSGQ